MRGIRCSIGTAPAKKAPATHDLIAAMLGHLPHRHSRRPRPRPDRLRLRLGHARSELVVLQVEDLTETSEGYLVLIRRSKPDQGGQG